MYFMKKNLAIGLFLVLVAVASCSFTNKTFENEDKDKLLLDLITYVLNKGHYEPKDIDDDFSVNENPVAQQVNHVLSSFLSKLFCRLLNLIAKSSNHLIGI